MEKARSDETLWPYSLSLLVEEVLTADVVLSSGGGAGDVGAGRPLGDGPDLAHVALVKSLGAEGHL